MKRREKGVPTKGREETEKARGGKRVRRQRLVTVANNRGPGSHGPLEMSGDVGKWGKRKGDYRKGTKEEKEETAKEIDSARGKSGKIMCVDDRQLPP